MKNYLVHCLALTLLCNSVWAQGPFSRATGMDRYDTNGDGKVVRSELRKGRFHHNWFEEFDADKNDEWSKTEFEKADAAYAKARAAQNAARVMSHQIKPKVEVLAKGLSNPCGLAIQPKTGQVFISDSAEGRIVRLVKGKLEPVITGFPIETYGKGPKYKIGPLGLCFLDEHTLVVGGGGQKDGQDVLSVFTVPAVDGNSITSDKTIATFKLPGSETQKGEGNFYGLARIDRYLYVTCNGDDTKGWIARATIKDNRITGFERRIASKKYAELDAPVAIYATGSHMQGVLLVGQAGEISVPGDSKISGYGPTGLHSQTTETPLHDITGLAAVRVVDERGLFQDVTYAIDFAWIAPSDGGLYSLKHDRETRQLVKQRLVELDKPTAMVFSDDLTTAYITTMGAGENEKNGELVKVILHENRPRANPRRHAAGLTRRCPPCRTSSNAGDVPFVR